MGILMDPALGGTLSMARTIAIRPVLDLVAALREG
jgi:hypothetical protein